MRDLQNIGPSDTVGQIRFAFALDVAGKQDISPSDLYAKNDGAVVLRCPTERATGEKHANRSELVAVAKQPDRNELLGRDIQQPLRAIALKAARRDPQLAYAEMGHDVRQTAAVIGVDVREHDGIEYAHSAIEEQRRDSRVSRAAVDEHRASRRAKQDHVAPANVD